MIVSYHGFSLFPVYLYGCALCIHVHVSVFFFPAVSAQDEDIGQFDLQDPLEESTTSLVSSSTSAYSSFPVDVVVYVRVQVSPIYKTLIS